MDLKMTSSAESIVCQNSLEVLESPLKQEQILNYDISVNIEYMENKRNEVTNHVVKKKIDFPPIIILLNLMINPLGLF